MRASDYLEEQPIKRSLSLRRFAKGAGAIVACLVALDLVATVVTLAIGSEFLRR